MANLARVALIDAALRKFFCDEEDSFQEFISNQNTEVSPYEHCNDNFCRHARKQADDVIGALAAAGFQIVKAG